MNRITEALSLLGDDDPPVRRMKWENVGDLIAGVWVSSDYVANPFDGSPVLAITVREDGGDLTSFLAYAYVARQLTEHLGAGPGWTIAVKRGDLSEPRGDGTRYRVWEVIALPPVVDAAVNTGASDPHVYPDPNPGDTRGFATAEQDGGAS
jgi:hypothetical protein